jgi:ring-1,2-phenylacetyl-CoA epoxidase subunit PaaC
MPASAEGTAGDRAAEPAAEPAADLTAQARAALAELLLALADDEFVIGFSDSEWTGIAPLLEEDVAMSSLAQDELGHSAAFYGLLGTLFGRDPDALAYDRDADAFRHARLVDHGRGDWATTIARRYLYDTADSIRLEALATSSFRPLADLVGKVRREETYHLLHAEAWLERLARAEGEPRARLLAAWRRLGPDGASVLAPLPSEAVLLEAVLLEAGGLELQARWLARIRPTLDRLGLPDPIACAESMDPRLARSGPRSEAFHWLWGEFTSVRRLDPKAVW